MQELSISEIEQVSGGASTTGAVLTGVGTVLGVVGTALTFTPAAPVGGALIVAGIGFGGLAYAYDAASEAAAAHPSGATIPSGGHAYDHSCHMKM